MEQENWKPVKGFEKQYKVSDLGNVMSLKYQRQCLHRLLSPQINKFGYAKVLLSNGTEKKLFSVHRLVAEAFVPNPNNYPHVDHIDGCKTNNRADNLRFVTASMNARNPITYARLVENTKGSHICSWRGHFGSKHPNSKRVLQYSIDGAFIREWGSTMDIERELGIRHSFVSDCCNGRNKTARGFIFKYLCDENV